MGLTWEQGDLVVLTSIVILAQRIVLLDAGLFFLAIPLFQAIGAYATAILSLRVGLTPWLAVPLAAALGGLAGALASRMARILKGDYLALASLGLLQAGFVAIRALAPGGMSGLAGIPPLLLPGVPRGSWPILDLLVDLGLFAAAAMLVGSLTGRRFGALLALSRDDEVVLEILGVNPASIRWQVMAISGVLAGGGGALLAHRVGVVEPGLASIPQAVSLLIGAMVAGRGRPWRAVLGGAFLVGVPQVLERLLTASSGATWRGFAVAEIVYGIALLAVAFLMFPRRVNALRGEARGEP